MAFDVLKLLEIQVFPPRIPSIAQSVFYVTGTNGLNKFCYSKEQ